MLAYIKGALDVHFLELQPWQLSFYFGDRLKAEVALFASAFVQDLSKHDLNVGSVLLRFSHGLHKSLDIPLSPFQSFQASLPNPQDPAESRSQYLLAAECPDALLLWALIRHFPEMDETGGSNQRQMLSRTAQLLFQRFPQRPDLPYQLIMLDPTSSMLTMAPKVLLQPGQCYSRSQSSLIPLQSAWIQGRYEDMWLGSLHTQIDGRFFPLGDHHIRGFSVIGEAERCLALFQQLYNCNPSEFQLSTISNMLFMALGCEQLPHSFVISLANHFNSLSSKEFIALHDNVLTPPMQLLSVNEKPTLVVVSSDLRQHPVGRFWLPIARRLQANFHVISIAGHSRNEDPIRSEIRSLSDEWWPIEPHDLGTLASRIHNLNASILIDLGGHTADNHPQFLTQRLASLQISYLGFYGPTYAKHCDWWVVDHALTRWISDSYPGSEPLWPLPGPSLCYLPELHNLPAPDQIVYRDSKFPVYGSFNHTRKLSASTRLLFAKVLSANPDAVLMFRSYSFGDPAVRRLFLSHFHDLGIPSHQLQPIPFAPSSREAMLDFARINLHLDTSPVSGTTTTMDSLAMGIPVLSSPTHYYAGSISSAILQHAGLGDHICEDVSKLPEHAKWLVDRYCTANSRRDLACKVRNSLVCDPDFLPNMFVEQLGLMLRQKQAS